MRFLACGVGEDVEGGGDDELVLREVDGDGVDDVDGVGEGAEWRRSSSIMAAMGSKALLWRCQLMAQRES